MFDALRNHPALIEAKAMLNPGGRNKGKKPVPSMYERERRLKERKRGKS